MACDRNNSGNPGLGSSIWLSKQEFGAGEAAAVCNVAGRMCARQEGQPSESHGAVIASLAPSSPVQRSAAHEPWGEEEASSHPTEPLVPSRPASETGLTRAFQEAITPTGKINFVSSALAQGSRDA